MAQKPQTVFKKFEVDITPEEEIQYGRRAAALSYELVQLKDEFARVKKNWEGKLQEASSEIYHLQRCVRLGKVEKELEATVEYDPKIRMVSYTIVDKNTGEVITLDTRPMTNDEFQLQIPEKEVHIDKEFLEDEDVI